MSFLAPLFLLGALAIALPLWLHWRQVGTAERRLVPSLLLFQASEQPSVRRRKLEHLALLALRIALILLLALAFARPILPRAWNGAPAQRSRLHLIVLDASLSMAYGDRWDRARSAVGEVLASLGPDDRAQIVRADASLRSVSELTEDAAALRSALAAQQPGASRLVEDALRESLRERVARLRSDTRESVDVVVHWISDFQRSSVETRESGLGLPPEVEVRAHPTADPSSPNWFVEEIRFSAGSDGRTRVEASVRGVDTPRAKKMVVLDVDGAPEERKELEIAADGRATFGFSARDWPQGETRVRVRIEPPDALEADDSRYAVLASSPPQRVLVVRERSASRAARTFAAALQSADPIGARIESCTPAELASRALDGVSVVVVADAALDTGAESRLRDFVAKGGGALLVAGPAVAGRVGTLQARLPLTGHSLAKPARAKTSYSIRSADGAATRAHAVVGEADAWRDVHVFQRASLRVAGGDSVLLRTDDGAPLLLEHPIGEGAVLVWASGLGGRWNDLPLHPVFLELVRGSIRHLADRGEPLRSLRVDDALDLRGQSTQIYDPRGDALLALDETQQGKDVTVREVGFYEVRRSSEAYTLAVNADARESDVRARPAQEIALLTSAPEISETAARTAGAPAASAALDDGAGTPLAWLLLALLAVLVVAESSVANWVLRAHRKGPV